jgi:small subunit ribosomal protein S1
MWEFDLTEAVDAMVKIVRTEDGHQGDISPAEFEKMLQQNLDPEIVRPGEMVSGKVVSIGDEFVFVDIGGKSEGMINVDEFVNDEGEIDVMLGDVVEATVVTLRDGVRLSRKLRKEHQTDSVLQDAFENQIPVEGKVAEVRKGGFGIELGSGTKAFCPISQIDNHFVDKAEVYLGLTYHFRIIEFSQEGRNIVVSRRVLLEEQDKARARETRERIKPGMLIDGTVKRIMPYGAFVDIGGMDGLVHVSEISWDRVENPADHLTEGQAVKVKVLGFDQGKDKLSLSIREAGSDPWDDVELRFPSGQNVSGTVTRVEPYGAFVRIATGIEGLVHVSDMTWAGRVRHAGEVVNVGDSVQVAILNIDRERKRISLGMKQIHTDPFAGIGDRYKVGKPVTGRVQRIGAGGVFVELEEGIVGFLPGSLAGTTRGEPLVAQYKPGKAVTLTVREVDPERRRVTLESASGESQEERSEFEAYMSKQGINKMGSFGELLQKALADKDKKK